MKDGIKWFESPEVETLHYSFKRVFVLFLCVCGTNALKKKGIGLLQILAVAI